MPLASPFQVVYGPVKSWRYGRSLGIDPIGRVSTCSFNCVYCQLGEIENLSGDRQCFVATQQILTELKHYEPWDVDVITLSGSGEPTLASNLSEILSGIKQLTGKPTLVLTNATCLTSPDVRQALNLADHVSVKLDGLTPEQLQRINRPIATLTLEEILTGIQSFNAQYPGELSVQTMVLQPWTTAQIETYGALIQAIAPHEVQLNTPSRPKPLQRELDGRGNHTGQPYGDRPTVQIKCVGRDVLQAMAKTIEIQTGIPVRLK